MKTILITAYAINPFKGSEDGTGWNITKGIAKSCKVILITRKNNVPHLDEHKSLYPNLYKNIQYYGFDLKDWILRIKKNSGARGYVAYFYLWQKNILKFIKQNKFHFDIAHSLNFHSDSQPTFLWKLGKPTFWGPIGHHPPVPTKFIFKQYGFISFLTDRLQNIIKWSFRNLDPNFRKSVRHTTKIFVINKSIQRIIKADQKKVKLIPAVAAEIQNEPIIDKKQFKILCAGRFHYMKGFDVAIESFARFLNLIPKKERKAIHFTLVGAGKEKFKLEKLAKKLNVFHLIEWIDWVDRVQFIEQYKTSSVFLFPSHEGAGMVVPEAMSFGLPVICFNNQGPGELVGESGIRIPYTSYSESVEHFSIELFHLFSDKTYLKSSSISALNRFNSQFTWSAKTESIINEYNKTTL